MSDWSAGYMADIGYTFGYYQELNPARARVALTTQGLRCPEIRTACELGFGQGLSTNIHAAGSVVRWHGTDFNPSQASFAQELAAAAGCGARLFDEAFAEFARRDDLPEFDFIGLHGIWSWISDENRAVIVDLVRRRLKVGGVLYISYNTLPGWAAFAPMRHLMNEHVEVIGAAGRGIVHRINDAVDFADRLLGVQPIFARANPLVADRIKKLKDQNRHYLAHEYFNRDWHPMHFATMAQWLEPAKLQFACSANLLDQIDTINLSAEQQEFLREIPDRMFRESVRDFMVNQQFRRDYWVKGVRALSPLEKAESMRALRLMQLSSRSDIELKVTGSLGEARLTEAVYEPLLDVIEDQRPRTFAKIEEVLKDKVSHAQLVQAVQVLVANGHLAPVAEEADVERAKPAAHKLNHHLLRKSRGDADVSYLCSPVTGSGVRVGRIAQLFLDAATIGLREPEAMARHAWQTLSAQGHRLVKDGQSLEAPEDNEAELLRQAQEFHQGQLPLLRKLMVI